MRQLKFIVNEQKLEQDPEYDFSGIVSGTMGYLYATFSWSKDWIGTIKVAEFKKSNKADVVSVPITGNRCFIPDQVLTGSKFYLRVVGKRGTKKILTNQILVKQEV